jgi:hypothetical protein
MKHILRSLLAAAALCAAALSAKAAPYFLVSGTQFADDWKLNLWVTAYFLDGGTVGNIYVDDIDTGIPTPVSDDERVLIWGALLNADTTFIAGDPLSVGLHSIKAFYEGPNGAYWLQGSYNTLMPTGDRPHTFVPDHGA